jgi:hypothetical protein
MRLVENVFSDELLAKLKKLSRSGKSHRSNLTDWPDKVIGWSGGIIIFDLDEELLTEVKAQAEPYVPSHCAKGTWHATIHLGTRMSYIPWHNDDAHIFNITVYLNTNWTREHAGYFIYADDDGCLKAVLPKYNLGLFYPPPIMHTVALSNFQAPLRESLQIFINR